MNQAQRATHDFLALCAHNGFPVKLRGGRSCLVAPDASNPLWWRFDDGAIKELLVAIGSLGELRNRLAWRKVLR